MDKAAFVQKSIYGPLLLLPSDIGLGVDAGNWYVGE